MEQPKSAAARSSPGVEIISVTERAANHLDGVDHGFSDMGRDELPVERDSPEERSIEPLFDRGWCGARCRPDRGSRLRDRIRGRARRFGGFGESRDVRRPGRDRHAASSQSSVERVRDGTEPESDPRTVERLIADRAEREDEGQSAESSTPDNFGPRSAGLGSAAAECQPRRTSSGRCGASTAR